MNVGLEATRLLLLLHVVKSSVPVPYYASRWGSISLILFPDAVEGKGPWLSGRRAAWHSESPKFDLLHVQRKGLGSR